MSRIDAIPNIATMQHAKSIWNLAGVEHPGNSMSLNVAPHTELPISPHDASSPKPAIIWAKTIYFCPESGNYFSSFIHAFTMIVVRAWGLFVQFPRSLNLSKVATISILVAVFAFASCSATVARQEVRQTQASWTSSGQDSGILSDSTGTKGFIVNQDWINGYDSLLKTYGKTLSPPRKKGDRQGIEKEGDHYRVEDSVMEKFLVLNQRRVDNQAP